MCGWWFKRTYKLYLCTSLSHRNIISSDVMRWWMLTWPVGFRQWWIAPRHFAAASVTAISTSSTHSSVGSLVQMNVSLVTRSSSLALALPSQDSVCSSLVQRHQLSLAWAESDHLSICPPEGHLRGKKKQRTLWRALKGQMERWRERCVIFDVMKWKLDRQTGGGVNRKRLTL